MHGCENRKRLRRMLSLPTRGVISAVDDSDVAGGLCSIASSFVKDVRKISIGDCALFKPPQESPPFIGIIRSFESDKENNPHVGVNWLYRPADVQLVKGVAVEAAPNEVFYSFHRDEIPAASLLHPCKVAFLPKGVELPSGVSSFVCRRVYDIANKRLWWLTDKDFINDRQEEVDQLLHKTQFDMHATVQQQQGGRSPKPVNSPMSTSQLKHSPDSVQNSTTAFPTQVKGKKRERSDQGSEPVKRERSSKVDDGDSSCLRSEGLLKSEIAKLTEKGGLVDPEAVERFVHLMQPDKSERRIDLTSRCLLAGVIAATDKDDCLNRFVQLKGLPVLDEWLQEVHKGKVGDSSSPRDHDKSVEDFLLILLRALDKLPVNLNALQMCNIGKSVNHLRSHRNSDIQKKSRSLVDTWKKRVEAEMNINDTRSSTTQGVQWPGRMRNDISHGGSRHASVADAGTKNPSQLSTVKSAPVKLIQGEAAAKSVSQSASPAIVKLPSSPASTSANLRDAHVRTPAISGSSELPITAARDDRSSSSSQSHTNSQCSSDHAKNVGLSGKEDARSSNSGSTSLSRGSGNTSRHRKTANGLQGIATSTVQRDVGSSKNSPMTKVSASEKLSQPSTCEKSSDTPVCDSNNHKLIVKISNRGRSPAQNVNGGSSDDPLSTNSRPTSPVVPEKHVHSERSLKEKNDGHQNNMASDMNSESWQGGLKDVMTASDEGDASATAAADCGRCQTGDEAGKLAVMGKAVTASKSELKSRKAHDSALSSINALIESCVKYSEANVPMSAGDEVGMNLLASVAAGEISKSVTASPVHSPQRSASGAVESCKSKPNGIVDLSHGELNQSNAAADVSPKANLVSGVCKEEQVVHPSTVGKDLPNAGSSLRSDEKPHEIEPAASISLTAGSEVAEQGPALKPAEKESISTCVRSQVIANGLANVDKNNDFPLKDGTLRESSEAGSGPSADALDQANDLKNKHDNKGLIEKLSPTVIPSESMARNEKGSVASCINNLLPGQFSDVKEDDVLGRSKLVNQVENTKLKQEMDSLAVRQNQEDTVPKSGALNQSARGNEVNLGSEDAPVGSTLQMNSPAAPDHDEKPISDSKDSEMAAHDGEKAGCERPPIVMAASSPAAGSSGMDGKLGFDLNEGFDVDDGKDGDLSSMAAPGCLLSVRLGSPLPSFSVASTSVGLPASITVAAAAKGPFVPLEDLLRNKGEVGWRGSAATSAFRPAEPRKVSDIPSSNTAQASDGNNGKQGRPRLEIDLNVADEMEDMGYQNDDVQPGKNNEFGTINGLASTASGRYAGGLDLDLNRVDEAPELSLPMLNNHRFDMPVQPAKLSSALANSDSAHRDFDLNDGPAADDTILESSSFNHHGRVNIPQQTSVGFRISSAEMGHLNPWYPACSTFSAIPIPAPLSDREQPFPIVGGGGGPSRILTGPAGTMQFNPDMYRGSVLSSSPAVPFPVAAQFPYPMFPFGTSFPLPSSSLQGGSTAFMDLSSGSRLCIPAVPSQLVGSAPHVTSQFPRPYVVSLSDVSNSVAVDHARKWGRQGLDLNAGPGGPDVDARDETLPMPPRPVTMGSFALTDEQSRMYSMAGGVMKRKEADGGWDSDRLNYKQPSWQ